MPGEGCESRGLRHSESTDEGATSSGTALDPVPDATADNHVHTPGTTASADASNYERYHILGILETNNLLFQPNYLLCNQLTFRES